MRNERKGEGKEEKRGKNGTAKKGWYGERVSHKGGGSE
jgi:hypothetical protein